jgi:predicted kinase
VRRLFFVLDHFFLDTPYHFGQFLAIMHILSLKKTKASRAVFLMGGPGSGKSYVRKRDIAIEKVLDCDRIKRTLPGYDPKNPMAVHEKSRQELKREFFDALAGSDSFVYDGTGSNAAKYQGLFEEARRAGFRVEIVMVRCSINVALQRNQDRTRTVPESIVRSKHATISQSFEILRQQADSVTIVQND